MIIYHYSSRMNKESILGQGLYIKDDDKMKFLRQYTVAVNEVLDKYRPNDLKTFINRNNCIFFTPTTNRELFKQNEMEVNLDTNKIDENKLYAFSHDDADKIWCEVVDAEDSGQHIDEEISVVAKRYWASMQTFNEYLKNKDNINYEVELLYFGEVHPDCIIIVAEDNQP